MIVNTAKLLLLSILLASAVSTHLKHAITNEHGKSALHELNEQDHDTSSTFSLYKSSLDKIKNGIVTFPPNVISTSEITVTSFSAD
jgi:hypothetical protein